MAYHGRDMDKLRQFFGEFLALEVEPYATHVDVKWLLNRREKYDWQKLPQGAVYFVMMVDSQYNRLEYEVISYGKTFESWSVRYEVIPFAQSDERAWAIKPLLRALLMPSRCLPFSMRLILCVFSHLMSWATRALMDSCFLRMGSSAGSCQESPLIPIAQRPVWSMAS